MDAPSTFSLYPFDLPTQLPLSPSLLQQNSLLQNQFLYNHLLLPTLFSSINPLTFKNNTNSINFQNYLETNHEVIIAINQNLTDVIKKNHRRGGKVYEEDTEERCRRKRSLAYSVNSVQGTLLGLQQSLVQSFLKKQLSDEVRELVKSMLSHLNNQQQSLDKIKKRQVRADDDSRTRRTTTRCREPFFAVDQECFYLEHKEKLGWHEAKSACHKLQAHLAEPESPKALARVLKKKKGNFNRCWIGGSDSEEEGVWKWLSGSVIGSNEWRPSQPSNFSLHGEEQDCLAILKKSFGGPPLDDFSCWADRAFVCETEPEC